MGGREGGGHKSVGRAIKVRLEAIKSADCGKQGGRGAVKSAARGNKVGAAPSLRRHPL